MTTTRRVTFPATRENGGEHRAREEMPMGIDEAIVRFDPFQRPCPPYFFCVHEPRCPKAANP